MADGDIGRCAVAAACVVFDSNARVLLVRHSYGRRNWELPGGGSLNGEDPLSAARRELREETSMDLLPDRLTGVYFEPNHGYGPLLHFVFSVASPNGLDPKPVPPEIADLGFWSLAELPRPLSDFTARRIADAASDSTTFAVVQHRKWLP
jgi:8-oxo-dGTP diphosphatase